MVVRKEWKHRLTVSAIFVLSTLLLICAGPTKAAVPPMRKQAMPPALLADYSAPSSSDFDFSRVRKGKEWLVSYRFKGLGKEHKVSCRLNIESSQKLLDKFSFTKIEKASGIEKAMGEEVRKNAKRFLSYGEPVFSVVYDSKDDRNNYTYSWRFRREEWATEYVLRYAQDDAKEFSQWYEKGKKELYAKAEREFMFQKGFLNDPQQGWIIDYSRVVESATPVLKSCIDEFGKEPGKSAQVLMSFFQFMPYISIQDKNTGWMTGGVRVPSSVILQNEGDCDSKAVTFCVLHRGYAPGLVIFRSVRKKGDKRPGHALVGVESYSSRARWPKGQAWPIRTLEATLYEKPVLVKDRYFTPCEVAGGKGSIEYGRVALRKEAKYTFYEDDYMAIPIDPPASPKKGR